MTSRSAWLRDLEGSLAEDEGGDELATALVVLASVAGQGIQIGEDEAHGASRRALLLLTAGGDPDRGLDLNGRAVSALAEEVRTVDRQLALEQRPGRAEGRRPRAFPTSPRRSRHCAPRRMWRGAHLPVLSWPKSSAPASYLPAGAAPVAGRSYCSSIRSSSSSVPIRMGPLNQWRADRTHQPPKISPMPANQRIV